MNEVTWENRETNPAFIPTFPNKQDDFGNFLSLPDFSSINSSFISHSTYGGESSNLAFSKFSLRSPCSEI